RNEMHDKVHNDAKVIWYDSVTMNGKLAWQNALNTNNLLSMAFTPITAGGNSTSNKQSGLSSHPRKSSQKRRFLIFTWESTFLGVDVWEMEGIFAPPSVAPTEHLHEVCDMEAGLIVTGMGIHDLFLCDIPIEETDEKIELRYQCSHPIDLIVTVTGGSESLHFCQHNTASNEANDRHEKLALFVKPVRLYMVDMKLLQKS
uniref:Glyco_hydro_85 domain-containing protein n=1 Tax=Globodera pallida TaxID=36090 RepID=A0A183CRA5_GLOPA